MYVYMLYNCSYSIHIQAQSDIRKLLNIVSFHVAHFNEIHKSTNCIFFGKYYRPLSERNIYIYSCGLFIIDYKISFILILLIIYILIQNNNKNRTILK